MSIGRAGSSQLERRRVHAVRDLKRRSAEGTILVLFHGMFGAEEPHF